MVDTVGLATAVVVGLATVVVWKVINSLWLRPRKLERSLRDQGFQGYPYRWITGDLPLIAKMTHSALSKPISPLSHHIFPRIMPFVHHIVSKYGTKSFIWYGRRPRVLITEPDMIREVFSKWEAYHKERPSSDGKFGLVMREGEEWKKIRRILNPGFHMEKFKCLLPVMKLSSESMLRKWEEMVAPNGKAEVDIWSSLSNMSADVIARAAFGTSFQEGKRIFQLIDQSQIYTFQRLRSVGNYIPGWRYMPHKLNRRLNKTNDEFRAIIRDLINKRKKSLKSGNYEYKDDLLGIMLESNEMEIKEQGIGMTMEDVIEECKLFHLAGEDTTAALLTWSMILLTQHQDWQTKAREEVLQQFGKEKIPDFEALNHLKIVTMILHETLRLYPPVTSLSRVIHQDMKLKNLLLLSGTEISLPVILVHKDPKLWGKDAHEFNPSRFVEGVSNAAKAPGSFFPFSNGPRACIGQNFALIEAKLVLSMILQRFSFELSASYVHAPRCLVSLEPQFGAPLILHKI